MRQFIAYVFCILIGSLMGPLCLGTAMAQGHITDLDCAICHTCNAPTENTPCVPVCPNKHKHIVSEHLLSEAPDTIVLDYIVKQFQAVQFDHKAHASMSRMGSSCETCHHYSPKDRIPPCRECHGSEDNPINIKEPSLKGAYHRQCMGCHRE